VRTRRIAASLCGKILCQKEMTLALLNAVLYPCHFECPSISIQWDKDNEHRASQEYLKHAKSHGKKKNLFIRKCGFLIHHVMGWLGASPDVRVTDPYSDLPKGIAEFKCPFSKKRLDIY